MSVPVRRLVTVLVAVAALLVVALPARAADPVLSIDSGNGRRTGVRFQHPDNPNCWVTLAVDNVIGFAAGGDAGPEFISPYGEVADGPCAVRFHVTDLRLRIDPEGVAEDTLVNDFFPSKFAGARNNTPDGPAEAPDNDACTGTLAGAFLGHYPLLRNESGNLYDERAPKDGECEGATQLVKNPLHNVTDYSPDASVVRARGDWINVGAGFDGEGQCIMRMFFEVRWSDGTLSRGTILSGVATYGDPL